MPINWKPDAWAKLAASNPQAFLDELATLHKPSASLFTKTYIDCAVQGFRALEKHQNTKYEATFFLELAKRLPHADAKKPGQYELGGIKNIRCERAPVEFLLWSDAATKKVNPAEKINYHSWLLKLQKPRWASDEHQHQRFSLENAPEWAAGYTEIQRGGTSSNLRQWLASAPIADCLGVVNAAGSLHGVEKPAWLTHCLDTVLARSLTVYEGASVYETMSAIKNAWKMPSASTDAKVVNLIREQPKGMSLLTHSWFGSHYGDDPYAPMLDWWSRQTPKDRGLMLHRWLSSESQTWDSLSKEEPNEKKPGTALDMFTRDAIDLPPSLGRDIVAVAPFEKPVVRTFLARVIPAIHAAELTVEPKEFKSYLLNAWDTLHEKTASLSIDGLLDLEP